MSIWLSTYPMPLVVLPELVDEGCIITDIAWSPDGTSLMFSSNDGSVGFFEFVWEQLPSTDATVWPQTEVSHWCRRKHYQVLQPCSDLPICSKELSGAGLQAKKDSQLKRQRLDAEPGTAQPQDAVESVNVSSWLAEARGKTLSPLPKAVPLSSWDSENSAKTGIAVMSCDDQVVERGTKWAEVFSGTENGNVPGVAGRFTVRDAKNGIQLITEPIPHPQESTQQSTVRLWETVRQVQGSSSSSLPGAGPGISRPKLRWQVMLNGKVQAVSLLGDAIAFVVEELRSSLSTNGAASTMQRHYKLWILSTAKGTPLLNSWIVPCRAMILQFLEEGRTLLFLDSSGQLTVWELLNSKTTEDNKDAAGGHRPRVLLQAFVPQKIRPPSAVGFLPGSCVRTLYLRHSAEVYVYNRDTASWNREPTLNWRPTLPASRLGTEASLKDLFLSIRSRQSTEPPSSWLSTLSEKFQKTKQEAVEGSYFSERLQQLSHRLSTYASFSSRKDVYEVLTELLPRAAEEDHSGILEEFIRLLKPASAEGNPSRYLKKQLRRFSESLESDKPTTQSLLHLLEEAIAKRDEQEL
eukprot:TRINITY_DN21085_c0_g1_i1.p1 TRINITY_DN21085_c0_g1~~TRINITY_DN21085_c0_g1_i1.p1  ORF type:complete len:648 (-),score=79.88 TRINITY_DN21085_c0_g1_i1:107-1840(-)